MNFDSQNLGLARHHWFKPAVAAWFALLVGGGTLAIWLLTPAERRDSMVAESGLAGLHHYFEAPVGNAGMLAVVGIAALLGFALGWAIAGRVVASSAANTLPFAPASAVEIEDDGDWSDQSIFGKSVPAEPQRRRVFSAREDIGEEGIAPVQQFDEAPDARTIAAFAADESGASLIDKVDELHHSEPGDVVAEPANHLNVDLTIEQLTARLADALTMHKARAVTVPVQILPAANTDIGEEEAEDAVVAFLRREASRVPAAPDQEPRDSQAMLQGALDRLDRLGKQG